MTNRPTDEQFEIARCWLESNEGEGDERKACVAVADWLEHETHERWLRLEARRAGLTVAAARRQLAAKADRCGT